MLLNQSKSCTYSLLEFHSITDGDVHPLNCWRGLVNKGRVEQGLKGLLEGNTTSEVNTKP